MRQPRFYSEQPLQADNSLELGGSAARHIARALRLSPGDAVQLFDGSGNNHPAVLTRVGKDRVSLDVGPGIPAATESPVAVRLWQGLCRGSRMDSIVQKTTELGVTAIEPFYADRGIVRMDAQRAQKRVQRWREIAISACEQSGRATVPDISPPESFAERIAANTDNAARILLHPDADETLGHVLQEADSIILLIGPEGGFTAAEVEQARSAEFSAVRLGTRILRTETAPVAALGIIQYLKGDLD
jgi:16S rRNA (uracil1498-N3)-methyltransferase